jgi:hypothetical protein
MPLSVAGKNLDFFRHSGTLFMELNMDLSGLNAYLQLIQDIIGGTVRRHVFTPAELDLLLDVQASHVRKNAKNEVLRRYLRTVQHQFATDGSGPLRFANFWETETQKEVPQQGENGRGLARARGATPA